MNEDKTPLQPTSLSSTTENPGEHTSIIEDIETYKISDLDSNITIQKNIKTLEKTYTVHEPPLTSQEQDFYNKLKHRLIETVDVGLHELEPHHKEQYLTKHFNAILKEKNITLNPTQQTTFLYYLKRDFLDYGKITPIMKDPNIEDISCDGAADPIYVYHRLYGNIKTSIVFTDEEELASFVIQLAQKCGKHITIADPMLDATMPDGSRIQMTFSTEVTAKGSTFTIRKFRDSPFTVTDLIEYHTFSAEMIAYLWFAVEHGFNAIIAGGTASGKTSALNAMSLFIPRESKIVSIEETRELNLPHPNWIPGIARSGFGEIVGDKMVGEIDLFDLMKAALRQRPEYILVGEIRGEEAYVLFQAMATGHTTYSTFHADSVKSLIHRLEGKPINIPRIMLQALDIVSIQSSVQLQDKNVRRCKHIVEIVDVDATTKEMLTNEVFKWDPATDTFQYSGKSYILEKIRKHYDMSPEQLMDELGLRVKILHTMQQQDIREFRDVATLIATYSEQPELMKQRLLENQPLVEKQTDSFTNQTTTDLPTQNNPKQKKIALKGLFKRRSHATE